MSGRCVLDRPVLEQLFSVAKYITRYLTLEKTVHFNMILLIFNLAFHMPLLEVVQVRLSSDFESSAVTSTQLHRDTYKEMLKIGDTCVLLLITLYNNDPF